MAAGLLSTWTFILGAGATAIGATFELSPIDRGWRLAILRRIGPSSLVPFVALAVLSGLIAVGSLLNVDTNLSAYDSPVVPWLLAQCALQILLLFGGLATAARVYNSLQLVPAVRSCLAHCNDSTISELKDACAQAIATAATTGTFLRLHEGHGPLLVSRVLPTHTELRTALKTALMTSDAQEQDAAIAEFAEWAKSHDLGPLDSYLQYYLVPNIVRALRDDSNLSIHSLFEVRLYALSKIVLIFGEGGATLTAANSANPIWDLIADRAAQTGWSATMSAAWLALPQLLQFPVLGESSRSIYLINLMRAVSPLAEEGSPAALYHLERIVTYFRNALGSALRTRWDKQHPNVDQILENVVELFERIDEVYADRPAIWATSFDLRAWILVVMRREQEGFASSLLERELADHERRKAGELFQVVGATIDQLASRRVLSGDASAYSAIKFPFNPFS